RSFKAPNTLSILFYILYIVSVINLLTIEQPRVEQTIIKYLPIALFPFLLQFFRYRQIVLDTFVYSIAASCIICIIDTYFKSEGYIFYYHNPTEILDVQLNYLSIFCCFSLAIIYTRILDSGKIKIIYYPLIVLFYISLSIFYNRTGIIITVMITLLFFVFYFIKYKKTKLLLLLVLLFGCGVYWMMTRPIVQSKFESLFSFSNFHYTDNNNGV